MLRLTRSKSCMMAATEGVVARAAMDAEVMRRSRDEVA